MKVTVARPRVVLIMRLFPVGPLGHSCDGLTNRGPSALSQGLLRSEGRCAERESVRLLVTTI